MGSAVGASFHEKRTPRFPLSDVRSKRRLPHLPQTVEGRVKIALLARDTWKSVDEEGLRFSSAPTGIGRIHWTSFDADASNPSFAASTSIEPERGHAMTARLAVRRDPFILN